MHCPDCNGNNLVTIFNEKRTTPVSIKCPDCLYGIVTVGFTDYLSRIIKSIFDPLRVSYQNGGIRVDISETLSITVKIGDNCQLEIYSASSSNDLTILINRLKEFGFFSPFTLVGCFPMIDVRCPLCGGTTYYHRDANQKSFDLACGNPQCLRFLTNGNEILASVIATCGYTVPEDLLTFKDQTIEVRLCESPIFTITYRQDGSRRVILIRDIKDSEAVKTFEECLPEKIFEIIKN